MIMKKEYSYIGDLSLVVRVCVCVGRSIFRTHLIFLYFNIPIEYSVDSFQDFIDKTKERNEEEERCLWITSINFVL